MEINTKENIIKDLIYEHASREKLQSLSRKKTIHLYVWRAVAAVTITALSIFGLKSLQSSGDNRALLVSSTYAFPAVAKSRSAQTAIVDDYINELNNKEYKKILALLNKPDLSEKDLYVKTHLLFVLDSLDTAESIIAKTTWTDNYNKEEMQWVEFLIKTKKGESKETLTIFARSLSEAYQAKSATILAKLK